MPQLPSGTKLYLSKLSIIDFQGSNEWFLCPNGHFWFSTPNLSRSSPPYSPQDEICFDFLTAPVPTTHAEAAEFVHVYFEDPTHGMYWRGDWLSSFMTSFDMTPRDKEYWELWLEQNSDFLDQTIQSCAAQSSLNKSLSGHYSNYPGEYMIHMNMRACEVGKEIVSSRISLYPLTQLMQRKHRLPESILQLDYEAAVNVVVGDLRNKGCAIVRAERSRKSVPSLLVRSGNQNLAVQVAVARAPDEATCSQYCTQQLRSFPDATQFGVACVGLLPTSPRSAEGHPGFHIKYDGIRRVQ